MKEQIECECGQILSFVKTSFVTCEKRVCPKCGKIYYVDEKPIDWRKVVKEK